MLGREGISYRQATVHDVPGLQVFRIQGIASDLLSRRDDQGIEEPIASALGNFQSQIMRAGCERQHRRAEHFDERQRLPDKWPGAVQLAGRNVDELVQHLNADQTPAREQRAGLARSRIRLQGCIDKDIGVEKDELGHEPRWFASSREKR